MKTYRADIKAANDNKAERRWRVLVGLVAFIFTLSIVGYYQTKHYLFEGLPKLPTKETMWQLNLKPNITLLDDQDHVIGHRGPLIGRPLKIDEMPAYLPQAFLAIEDERFYEHTGIDRKALMRALMENTKSGRRVQGGSTLTQQLVKNMLLTPEKNYKRKFQEMWLAYEMEHVLTKPEILELYLNRIALGPRIYGVEAAAQKYFGKSASQVTLPEAAMLAAMPKAPSRYDPTRNFDSAWERAKLVLQRMAANNMITLTQMSEAENTPPEIIQRTESLIAEAEIGYIFDMVTERAHQLVGSDHHDLIIHTTLNTDFQHQGLVSLEKIISRSEKSRKVSEGALVLIDSHTGEIKTLVGGRDYNKSKFNRAVQAKRQPGSSFKAFVYAAALEAGYTPGTVRVDQPINIAGWSPENYTKRYRGPMTLREALKLSINTVAAQVSSEIGPSKVAQIATRFGITTEMRPHYSIALGASEVTLLDMTAAYMVFANYGVKRPAYIIREIQNTSGETLYTHKPVPAERVYAERYAGQMVTMLRDVVATGTGRGAQMGEREIAGKTGTSQDFRDAWFMGFSADYTAGVWMGNDDNSSMAQVTGGLLPADAWKDFMLRIHKGKPFKPLVTAAPEIQDAFKRQRMDFYLDLVEALLSERNLAIGISVPESLNTDQSPVSTSVQPVTSQDLVPTRAPAQNNRLSSPDQRTFIPERADSVPDILPRPARSSETLERKEHASNLTTGSPR